RVVEDLEDVLVAQLGHRLRLALEAIARLLIIRQGLVQHLDRDHALEPAIKAAIDDPHPALPDALEQFVLVEYLADLDHMLTCHDSDVTAKHQRESDRREAR